MKIMKKLMIIVVSLVLLQSCGLIQRTELRPSEKTKVVQVPESNKDELYIRGNTWMVETFNNAKSVIQFSDKENGIITGRYLMKTIITSTTTRDRVYSIIKIQVKDGSAKITITPSPYYNTPNPYAGGTGYSIEDMNTDISLLIKSFSNGIVNTETTDW